MDLLRQTNTNIPNQIKIRRWCNKIFYCQKTTKSCCKPFFRLINCNRINLRMERQKILNLSDKASNSKTAKRKWNINIKG